MKKTTLILLMTWLMALCGWSAKNKKMVSPNKKLTIERKGEGYVVYWNKLQVLELSEVGMETTSTGQHLTLKKISKSSRIQTSYDMIAGKRLLCNNQANEYVCLYQDQQEKKRTISLSIIQ